MVLTDNDGQHILTIIKNENTYHLGGDHMATFIVGAVVLAVVGLIIRSLVKNKKNGKSLQCGCDCKHCNGHCH